MTAGELIHALSQVDHTAEVRLAFQPDWPLEYNVGQVATGGSELADTEVLRDDDGWCLERYGEQFEGPFETAELAQAKLDELLAKAQEGNPTVYIGEGGQLGYLPTDAAKALGWK